MRLANENTIVTGGSSGLGLATVNRLVDAGATVCVIDLPTSWPPAAAELGPAFAERVHFVPADVTSDTEMRHAVEVARNRGPIRALVHCAGRGSDRLRIVDRENQPGDLASFLSVITINLVGTYNVLRVVAASMSDNAPLESGSRGACVLTTSVAAFEGQVGQTSYSASKAGVHSMVLVAARDLATHGIRVNGIAPGTFDTPMLARLRDDLREKLASDVPFPKRLGLTGEFAQLAVNVLENDYLNGETIRLDGAIRMAPK